jgi:hypothetical protein
MGARCKPTNQTTMIRNLSIIIKRRIRRQVRATKTLDHASLVFVENHSFKLATLNPGTLLHTRDTNLQFDTIALETSSRLR